MEIIQFLKSMWPTKEKSKVQRATALIIPIESLLLGEGNINHSNWSFVIPYAFRDALDVKYEKRMKEKKPYYIWTQGPILSFKEGDTLLSKLGSRAVQVKFASAMGWDPDKNEMYRGSVVYETYDVDGHNYKKINRKECNQMEFLQVLIHG